MALWYSPAVERLTPYTPGLSAQDVASEFGVSPSEVVKLGSGENPLGPSPVAIQAISEVLGSLNTYPDWTSADLRRKVASLFDVSEDEVICGAGETEVKDKGLGAMDIDGDTVDTASVWSVRNTIQEADLACRRAASEGGET